MESNENSGLLDELIQRCGFELDSSFLKGFRALPDGFCFEQSTLKGGCMVWLFFSVIVPFGLWVSPGKFSGPWQLTLLFVIAMVIGWFALAYDVTQKVIITARPGVLCVERRRFGMGRPKEFSLTAGGLEVYRSGASAGGMMVVYNLRIRGRRRGLGLRLEYREARALRGMIEFVVLGRGSKE